jgi:hypothetical protein
MRPLGAICKIFLKVVTTDGNGKRQFNELLYRRGKPYLGENRPDDSQASRPVRTVQKTEIGPGPSAECDYLFPMGNPDEANGIPG